jgi:hypothetical protein
MVRFEVSKDGEPEEICYIVTEKTDNGVYIGVSDDPSYIDTYLLEITKDGISLCDSADNDFVKTYNGYVVVKKE